ncbi:DUF4760 domain-containing protein [Bradyrhizobium diazoefficiens]|uniref:DUF4760 domain-containing protein n=1 Tax=Bradyrhizobium TaxID=374 RepID=UPI0013749D58|nr:MULTISPECIES: DUF4760 domain-containing protein [Bradyrhizobium]QLD43494.1 DUF4760 domain-containing protein [Bradyrhizobium diazoefficiens]
MALDYGSAPQWVTAFIAATAGYLAFRSIQSQRSIARRRAAFDLFLKTETDEKMLTAYDYFHDGIEAMRMAPSAESFCTSPDDQTRKHYLSIRKYLNVHELVAVGIREEVLDPEVCYSYWGDTLTNNYRDAKPVLDFLAKRDKNKYTYSDLHELNSKWAERKRQATV